MMETHLAHDIAQLLLHLLLGTLEPLPQVVAHAALLQQRAARLLGRPELHQAAQVLERPAQQGRADDAVGDGGGLLAALGAGVLGRHVKQRQVDVALQVRAEPRLQVGQLGCRCVSNCTGTGRQGLCCGAHALHCKAGRGRERHTGTTLAVDAGKDHQGAAQNHDVGKGQGQALPVNLGDGDHGGRCRER